MNARLDIPAGLDATLVLVRHGESTWIAEGRFQGASDPPLSATGERQAELVAMRLANPLARPPLPVPAGDPVGCWHSPLRRAAAVAERIAERQPRPLPLHADPRLREIAQGTWEGAFHDDIAARDGERYRGWRRDPTRYHGPGGEDLADAAARVAAALSDLLAALDGRDEAAHPRLASSGRASASGPSPWGLVVGHDGAFRLAFLTLFDLPLERFWLFPFGQCAISVIDVRAGRPMLRAHNLAAHLAPLATPAAHGAPLPGGAGATAGGAGEPLNPGSREPEDRAAL